MPRPLYVITPTGDRPQAFALCVSYVNRQTRAPDKWIVVDDGTTDAVSSQVLRIRVQHEIVSLPPMRGNSIVRNLREALSRVPDDAAVCVIEDDDWYPPGYLKEMDRLLMRHPYVGVRHKDYYNVRHRLWKTHNNRTRMALHGSGFSGEALSAFRSILMNPPDGYPDSVFGEAWLGDRGFNDDVRPVHIVGYGTGRRGTTGPHRVSGDSDRWTHDPDGTRLRLLIGDDADHYLHPDAKVYVLSNVDYPAERRLDVRPDDLLVFLNYAKSLDYYQDHANKVVYRRKPKDDYGPERLCVRNRYAFDAGDLAIPKWFTRRLKETYDWDYPIEAGKARCATTGYIVAQYMRELHPVHELVLVNFGYSVSNSTYRCPYHNWRFEDNVLRQFRHVFTADTVQEPGDCNSGWTDWTGTHCA